MSGHQQMSQPRSDRPLDYEAAGVSIERGDAFAEFIRSLNPRVVGADLGGFAGGLELDLHGYRRPVLFSATDGVGTKLLIAQQLERYDTLGIDLVAMCVNDLIVCGAQPLAFLDYIACERVEPTVLEPLMEGIVRGCEIAGCRLVGGETAEMPDLYGARGFDIAGFAVGIAERDRVLPQPNRMQAGDCLLGLPSSGVHSNGLSLARRVLTRIEAGAGQDHDARQRADELRRALLEPTIIYTKELEALLAAGGVTGAAHVTGGGLVANTQRVLPGHLKPQFRWDWHVPPVFRQIAEDGEVSQDEMRRVFNMGIGMVVVVPGADEGAVRKAAEACDVTVWNIGELVDG